MSELDDQVKKDALKSNLHKQMLNNLPIVDSLIGVRNSVFYNVCWDHGVLNKKDAERLLEMLVKGKFLQVNPVVK